MAGRPAAARGGSSSGMLYGLIVFAILAVGGIGAFIWQLTNNQRLIEEAARANQAANRFGNPNQYYVDEANARGSKIAAVMQSQIEDLATLTVGQPDALPPAIKDSMDRLLARLARENPGTINPDDTLRTALITLARSYQNTKLSQDMLIEELANIQAEKDQLAQGFQAAEASFREELASIKDEAEQREQTKADELAAKDAQLAEAQEQVASATEEAGRLRAEINALQRDHEVEIARFERLLGDLRDQVIANRPGGFDPYDILAKADGKVLRALPGSDVVFINLGRTDGIRTGMTFEVYSSVGNRSVDRRGKASIEVSQVNENVAEAIVTRQRRGQPIVEDDIIVNLSYEKTRKPQFVVRGEFDLDYDGVGDWNGLELVTSLIERWGGEVVANIDNETDFVIVGRGPQIPQLDGDRPITDVIRNLAETRQERFDEFEDELLKARELYIPVITQSQLLFMSGYAGQELAIGT